MDAGVGEESACRVIGQLSDGCDRAVDQSAAWCMGPLLPDSALPAQVLVLAYRTHRNVTLRLIERKSACFATLMDQQSMESTGNIFTTG